MPKRKNPAAMKFEQALSELEKIVEKMESEDLPLEEAIKYYETGTQLSRQCQTLLDEAEQKIAILSSAEQADSEVTTDPLVDPDD
ncbi:MAG: exodeoxyribonuclease VII small subunit [Thiotrichales bacterium]